MITLYATEPGSIVHLEGSHFQVFFLEKLWCEIAAVKVKQIILFDWCDITGPAIKCAIARSIPVGFIADGGRYVARLHDGGKCLHLRRQKQCFGDAEFQLAIVESLLRAKLHNSRVLLMQLNSRRNCKIVGKAIDSLAYLLEALPAVTTRKGFWQFEAASARIYFQAFSYLLPAAFNFQGRSADLAGDRINSLLNLGYALLSQNLYACVQKFGLNPDFGNLHHTCFNHTPLVCDLMEQFRAPIVEALVADLVNQNCIKIGDFLPPDERGGLYLHPAALREFLLHWETKLQSFATHLYAGQVSYRHCLELQVKEYLACVTGEQDVYRSMLCQDNSAVEIASCQTKS
ncbi:CRISPR-associated endonuclease Cas1 [Microcoleus sp. F6_B4]